MKKFCLLFIAAFFNMLCTFAQAGEKKNIIFIVLDDLNDYIEGMNSQPQIQTPNIKALIDKGILFTNAFSNSPVCGPSRTSFLSGKDLKYTQVYDNNTYIDEFRNNFTADKNNEEVITLPEQLKNKGGYYTCSINKVFHNPFNKDYDVSTPDPCEKALSWSKVISFSETAAVTELMETYNQGVQQFRFGKLPNSMEQDMKDYRAVDSAISVLQKIADGEIMLCENAFFLGLGFALPHLNLYVPEKYFPEFYLDDIYADTFTIPYNYPVNTFPYNGVVMPPQPEIEFSDYNALGPLGKSMAIGQADIELSFFNYVDSLDYLPEINPAYSDEYRFKIVERSKQANAVMAYMAAIQFVDAQIGRLLEFLNDHPDIYNNSIIILVGDNGFSFGEKYHWMKRSFWEPDVRIPFIIVDPSKPGGIICDQAISLLDLYPTICDLTATPYPLFSDSTRYLDGKSIVPILNNNTIEWERPVLITLESEDNKECSCFPQYAVRNDNFKYIYYVSDGSDPTNSCNGDLSINESELYEIGVDRTTDPNEWNNLISNNNYKPIIDYLQQWLPDSALYLQKTFKLKIKNAPLPCVAKYSDTIKLSFDIYDTAGTFIAAPANYKYIWTNNLTTDTLYGLAPIFPLALLSADDIAENQSVFFFLQMKDTINTIIAGIDKRTFYFELAEKPEISFDVSTGNMLTAVSINNINISGPYKTMWWDFGNGYIYNGSDPGTYVYPEYGKYLITAYINYGNDEGCIDSFSRYFEAIELNAGDDEKLLLYPNPTTGEINIATNEHIIAGDITIRDITGKQINTIHFSDNPSLIISISVANLNKGAYFISLKSGGGLWTEKFILL